MWNCTNPSPRLHPTLFSYLGSTPALIPSLYRYFIFINEKTCRITYIAVLALQKKKSEMIEKKLKIIYKSIGPELEPK